MQDTEQDTEHAMHAMDEETQRCVDLCQECHRVCLHMVMHHCLESGGAHVAPPHVRLMLNCAEICQTAAYFLLSGSELHHLTCGVCAEVCEKCADDCERLDGMEQCVAVCRRCATSCRAMATAASC